MSQPIQQEMSSLQTQNLSSSASPPLSAPSSPASLHKKRSHSPLSLDLSNLPPLSQPAPPSNTLLITRLDDAKIFHPASLATIRQHINSIAELNSFSPLKSMHRIICSFHDTDAAIQVRQVIDGSAFLEHSVAKCYFGEPTPIGDEKKYLNRPDAGRLFFISPPPSPPVGWEMKSEDPPNKLVHADDLASKLAKLSGKLTTTFTPDESGYTSEEDPATGKPLQPNHSRTRSGISVENSPTTDTASPMKLRSRSATLIYDPKDHGDSPALPAVMLETEDESDVELDQPEKKILEHTSRPPVELM